MSTQPRLQQVPTTQGDPLGGSRQEPGAGERPRVTEEKIIKTTRFEVGFFVRKVVDGRVVRQWQFPPAKQRPVSAAAPPPAPPASSGGETDQAASDEAPQIRALALESSASTGGDQATGGSTDSSGDGSSTTYEVGFFVRTETVTPPDFGGDQSSEPPPS